VSESGVTLKTGLGFVQGHWKWHHLIDRIRVPIRLPYSNYMELGYYYCHDDSTINIVLVIIIIVAISCIVCEIQRLIGRKSRNFYTPPVFSTPAGVTLSEFRESV